MNHLAHFALAGRDDALMVGGFLGDFVKGPVAPHWPDGIALGIRLHRAIDAQTARDPDIRRSVARFGPELRRTAPIFLDILGDHFLARAFDAQHGQPLHRFTQAAYAALARHRTHLPEPARQYGDRLRQFDALAAYVDMDIVVRGFERVATRLARPDDAHAALAVAERMAHDLRADFEVYYPRLRAFVDEWLAAASTGS